MTKKPEPVLLFEIAGHTPAPPPAFEVPQGPGTLPRPAYLAWCAVKAAGELAFKCEGPCRGIACCVAKVMAHEHGIPEVDAAKAVARAEAAGWLARAPGGGRSLRAVDPEGAA